MKLGKKCISLILALVMVLGLTVSANAAAPEMVTVQLSSNITVKLNGEIQTMTDVNGNPVYPVLYGGTTYLPIRAVGNMLGLDVDWDGATQTVLLEKADSKTTPAKTGGKAPTDAKPTEITVQINPNIAVKYNGKAQAMTDVNGNPVYPMLYGGTTYLPVRAVSKMLGVKVDWDGATQTVVLSTEKTAFEGTLTITAPNGREVNIDPNNEEASRKALEDAGCEKNFIDAIIASIVVGNSDIEPQTSANAKVLGENHIGYDWTEIDWSTANKGYVRVKVNEQLTENTDCTVRWYNDNGDSKFSHWALPLEWTNIPLFEGKGKYVITISQEFGDGLFDITPEEMDVIYRDALQAVFTADIENLDATWLLSTPKIDFDHAPEVTAKAKELTKDCKTDAEKITVIFEYVAKTIKYDYDEYKQIIAETIKNNIAYETGNEDNIEGKYMPAEYGPLSEIFENKKGICHDYARLMAGMLRSLGIPCKVCVGPAYTGRIVENYSEDGWENHAWVAVKPESGTLDKQALGAGNEADGWIRLDPTWGNTSSGRANAAIDKNHKTGECY